MNISEFDYELPLELIAQHPSQKREDCRLLVVHRDNDTVEHKHFYDILDYLKPGDCLVMNDSKVLPARMFGVKEGTGAKIEFLLSKRKEGDIWETIVRPGKRLHPGAIVSFGDGKLRAEILDYGPDGTRIVKFMYDGVFLEILEEIGRMPLPPYIERETEFEDKDRYQTVYCREEGSVAAPTAGLHFTEEILEKAKAKGVKLAFVTLHVGIGTFRPVKCEVVEEHKMHFEEYTVSQEAADIINQTKAEGGRIISVGTTSTRTLESASDENGVVKAGSGSTGIFIYPGYKYKVVNSLITNFHLPKSTLLMLISALYNRERILDVYKTAVEEKYQFFSYGDAMFIE
ncbi:MAG: tRNA preQ1(34) S-adenosylmethionine ribosyltransferase-isomerase QueA [Firmicutes bacterium]|nr:tRNA preQ1(34) S-adenosylmethionine ribosyltransferase-isomerase QueA [Bacillota bacterium]MBQ5797198.1 tRNA preQ1(34) S-adenosylmethionine ribosyltransferase-isomerase QueA [Bacillota bacterium]